MLTASHSNPWIYGGILDRVEWQAGEAQVRCWGGRTEAVKDGDTVLVLQTGAYVQFVKVEPGVEGAGEPN